MSITISNSKVSYGPSIVTDGLVLYLDAANPDSYPGSGAIWYDLSGLNNHCNFSSIPTYNSSYFTFNGTSNYGTITNNSSLNFSSEKTLIMLLKHNFTTGRRNPWDQAYGGYGTWTHEAGASINEYYGDSGANASPYVGRNSSTTPRNVWNFLATTRDTTQSKWYVNTNNTDTYNHSYGTLTSTAANIRIGRGYAGYWEGDMSIIITYIRKLTPTEILQNYNSLKSRFGY